jgi:hypothetical protein
MFTEDELNKLIPVIPDKAFRNPVLFGIYSGCRVTL